MTQPPRPPNRSPGRPRRSSRCNAASKLDVAKLIDRFVNQYLLAEKRAGPELVITSLQRVLIAQVEAENVLTLDQNELTLAIGPRGKLGLVGPHFLRQWNGGCGCLSVFLLLMPGSALCRHRPPPFTDSVPFAPVRIVRRAEKSALNRLYAVPV